jgi:transcriptional regulator with XRE-family HTH domain
MRDYEMTDDESIGRRIARQRRARGITQTALAQEAQVSLSLLRKIEQGSRLASQPVLAALTKALHVDLTTLTGQPYDREGPRPDRLHAAMPNLRRALLRATHTSSRATRRRSLVCISWTATRKSCRNCRPC